MAVSLYIVVKYETLHHIVIGACVAPLFLLRTKESNYRVIQWCEAVGEYLWKWTNRSIWFSIPVIFLLGIFPLVGIFVIKFTSVLIELICNPIQCLLHIPCNWRRQILFMDSIYPPEILPETDNNESEIFYWTELTTISNFNDFWFNSWSRKSKTTKMIDSVTLPWAIVTYWGPAFIYRWSLKATALVYLPLIWLLHGSLHSAETIWAKIDDIVRSPVEQVKRWYSWFVILALVVLPASLYLFVKPWWVSELNHLLTNHPTLSPLLLTLIPLPTSGLDIAFWHVARGLNAAITLAIFVYSERLLRHGRMNGLEPNEYTALWLSPALFARGLMTLYIIACTIWILASSMNWRDFYPVNVIFFPGS